MSTPALVPNESLLGLVWEVFERKERVETALHIVEAGLVPPFALTHSRELHRAKTKKKLVVRHASLNDAETLLFL